MTIIQIRKVPSIDIPLFNHIFINEPPFFSTQNKNYNFVFNSENTTFAEYSDLHFLLFQGKKNKRHLWYYEQVLPEKTTMWIVILSVPFFYDIEIPAELSFFISLDQTNKYWPLCTRCKRSHQQTQSCPYRVLPESNKA